MSRQVTQLLKAVSATALRKPPVNDLDRAYRALSGKLGTYNLLWDYYDGDQPLMYTSKRMDDIFKDLEMSKFMENWCAVVVDSAQDRIVLKSLSCDNTKAQDQLTLDWEDHDLAIEASDTHEAALVIGEAFIIAWEETNEDDEDELGVFYNDPRLCHLFYKPSNPKKKLFGAKWWIDAKDYARITLYYPERLEYYRTIKASTQVRSHKSFEPYSPTEGGEPSAENPYGEVPFFHFRLERRKVKSDLTNIIPLQNGINKLVTDMMVAAEFGAFPQRWVISHAELGELKNVPWEIWGIPAGDGTGQRVSVGQFAAADLENYIKAKDSLASAVAIISRTPKHYLVGRTGGDLSGEALIAMEAPLNKRCSEHIAQFKPIWKDLARFILKVRKIDVERRDINVIFEKPETVQPKTEAEIRNLGKSSGIPLNTLLRDEGKDEAWIEQMEADKKAAKDAAPMLALLSDIRKRGSGEE